MRNDTFQKIETKMQKAIKSHNLERDKLFVVVLKNPEEEIRFSLCSLENNEYNIIGNLNEINKVKLGENFSGFYQNLKDSESQEVINVLGNTKAAKFVKKEFSDLKEDINKSNKDKFIHQNNKKKNKI